MKTPRLNLFSSLILAFALGVSIAHPQEAEEVNEKALKYHGFLKKRPGGGYLFERFYNAWLDTNSLEGLQDYLTKQSKAADSTTADALILGFFHARQGEDTLALEIFSEALKNDPNNASAWLEKAKLSTRSLDFETALKDLDQVIAKSNKSDLSMEAAKMKGRLLLRTGKNQEAIELWTDLLKDHSDDENLHEDLIENQIDEGLYEEAIKTSKTLVEKTKDPYLKVLRKLRTGDIYQRLNQRDNALKAYQDSLSSTGAGSWVEKEILSQIEQVFRKEDDIAGLSEFLADLSNKETQRPSLVRKHAEVLMELSETDEAIKLFDQLLAKTPGERPLREAYIDLLAKAEQFEKAVNQTETLIEQNTEDSELLIRLAILQNKAGQDDKINATLDRYLEQTEGVEFATMRVARLQEAFGNPEAAESSYRKFLESNADNTNAQETFAAFLHRIDKKEEAISIWKKLAAGGNRDQIVRMARSLVSRQEFEAAFEILQSRYDEFQSDIVYLGQLCTVAIRLEKYDQAIDWARHRVRLVKEVVDMDQAIRDASLVIDRSGKSTELIKELSAQEKLSDQDVCLLAELLEKEGSYERSDKILEGRDSDIVINQKIRLLKLREDWQAAAKATRELIANSGGRKSNFLRDLVELYRRSDQIDLARKTIPEWKTVSPGSIDPWLIEADLAENEGDEEKTIAILRSASRKFPDDTTIRSRLATTYRFAGKYADAKRIYLNLYESSDDLSEKIRWISELAQIHNDEGKIDQLIAQFEERKRNNRQSVGPLLALSEIYRTNDEYEERRKTLLEASRLKPRDVNFMLEIARIEENEGNWEDAIKTLERAKAIDNSPRIIERIAHLHLRFGDEEEGYQLIDSLAGKLSSDPKSILKFANGMADKKQWERLIEFLASRIDQHDDDYRFHYLKGIAHEELDEVDSAIASFSKMLSIDNELKSIKPSKSNRYSYQREMIKHAPKGIEKFINYQNFSRSAYSYLQQNNYQTYGLRTNSFQSRSSISLPPTIDAAKVYAICHLKKLLDYMEEEESKNIRDQLTSVVPSQYKIFLDNNMQSNNGYSLQITEEVLDQYPDDLALQYMWLNYQARNSSNVERIEKIHNKLEEDFPLVALQAAILAFRSDKEVGQKLMAKSFKHVKSIEEPNVLNLQILTGLAQSNASNQIELTDEQDNLVRSKLLEIYPKTKDLKSQYSPWIFATIAASLAKGDEQTYIKFLEERIKESSTSKKNTLPAYYRNHNQSGAFIVPISFPPKTINQFPSAVLALLQRNDRVSYGNNNQPPSPEKTEKWHQLATDPILKLLLANKLDLDSGIIQKSIQQLEKSKNVDPIAVAQLLAGYYVREGKHSSAIAAIEKIRYRPMSRSLRQEFDRAILHSATQLDSDENQKVIEAGKAAALRISYSRITPQNRSELISAMSTLGMEDAAEKQEKKLNNAPATSLSSRQPYYNSNFNRDRIKQLVGSGKRELAIKELTSQIKSLGNQFINGQTQNHHYNSQQIIREMQRHSLTDDVISSIENEKKTNIQKQLEYAGACLILKETDKGINVLKEIIAKDPRKTQAKTLLATLLLRNRPEDALEVINALDSASTAKVAVTMLQDFNYNRPKDPEEYYKSLRACFKLLNKVEDRTAQNWQWPTELVKVLTQQWYNLSSNITSPSLYSIDRAKTKPVVDPENQSDKNKQELEIWTKRWQLHDEMVAELWKIPQLQHLAFWCEQSGAYARETEFDEVGQAKKALLTLANLRAFPLIRTDMNEYSLPSLSEVLVIDAFKNDNHDQLKTEFTPKLKDTRNGKVIEKIQDNLLAIYFTDDDNITKEFTKRFYNTTPKLFYQSYNSLQIFERLVKHRQIKPEVLAEYLLALSKRTNHRYPDQSNSNVVIRMGKQSPEVFEKFLNDYCEYCCGKPAERTQQQQNVVRQFSSYLNAIEKEPSLFPIILDVYQKQKLSTDYCYTFTNSDTYTKEKFFQYFSNSQLLSKEAKDFRVLGYFKRNSKSGFESLIYGITRYSGEPDKKAIIEKLKEMGGFGPTLLSAIAESKQQEAFDLTNKHLDELKTLPEEAQHDFCAMMKRTVFPKLKEIPDGKLSSWVRDNGNVNSDKQLSELLAAKRVQDITNIRNIYYLKRKILPLMTQFEKSSPDKTKSIYKKFTELAETERRTNQHSGENWRSEEQFLADYADQSDGSLDRVAIICDIIAEQPNLFTYFGSEGQFEICDIIYRQFKGKDKAAKQKSLEELFTRLHEIVGENKVKQLILTLEFRRFFDLLSSGDEAMVIDWATENQEDQPYSYLVKEFVMSIRLMVAKYSDRENKYKNLERQDSYLSHFGGLIADETLPSSLRIALAHHLVKYSRGFIPEATIKIATKELIKALNEDSEVPYPECLESILSEFQTLPIDEEWKTIAASIPKAYNKQTRYAKLSNQYLYYEVGPKSATVIHAILCRLNDESLLNAFSARYREKINATGSLISLIQYGHQDRALALVKKHKSGLLGGNSFINYHSDLDTLLPEFLTKIEDPQSRYLTEFNINKTADLRKTIRESTDSKSRELRLVSLAKKFKDVELDPSQAKTILPILWSAKEARPHISFAMKESFDSTNFERLRNLDDYSVTNETLKPLVDYALHELQTGNPEPACKMWSELAQSGKSRNYHYYSLRNLTNNSSPFSHLEAGKKDIAKGYLKFYQTLISNPPPEPGNHLRYIARYYFTLVSIFGEDPAFLKNLPKERADVVIGKITSEKRAYQIPDTLVKAKAHFNDKEKIAMVDRLVNHPWSKQLLKTNEGMISNLAKGDFLSLQKMEPQFDQWIKALPRDGLAALDVSKAYTTRKKYGKAIGYCNRAIEQGKSKAIKAHARLLLAENQTLNNDFSAAQASIDKLNKKDLPRKLHSKHASLVKSIKAGKSSNNQ